MNITLQVDGLGEPRTACYEQLAELGEGSTGRVFKVRDSSTSEIHALKRFKSESLLMSDLVRFHREIEVLNQLDCQHIVRCHESGRWDGDDCFVMEFCPDTLAKRIAACQDAGQSASAATIPSKQVLRWSLELAGALATAHTQGILHRDLKPSNVLLTEGDRIKLCDFGLARQLSNVATMTEPGRWLGTPAYLAPEQVAPGSLGVGSERTDVYAFGLILYELLAGRHAYPAILTASPERIPEIIQTSIPRRPKAVDRTAARLSIVCMRCLEKDPELRYASALDLQLDLQRIDQGLGPQPRRWTNVIRGLKWADRHPLLAATVTLLLLSGVIATFVLGQQHALADARFTTAIDAALTKSQRGEHASALQDLRKTEGELSNRYGHAAVRARLDSAVAQIETVNEANRKWNRFRDLYTSLAEKPFPLTTAEAVAELDAIRLGVDVRLLWPRAEDGPFNDASLTVEQNQALHAQAEILRSRYLLICKHRRLRPIGWTTPLTYITDTMLDKCLLAVDTVTPGSVAESHGIKPGDKFITINDKPAGEVISTMDPNDWISGPPGTPLVVQHLVEDGRLSRLDLMRPESGKVGLVVEHAFQAELAALPESSPLFLAGARQGDRLAYFDGQRPEKFDADERRWRVMDPLMSAVHNSAGKETLWVLVDSESNVKRIQLRLSPENAKQTAIVATYFLMGLARQELMLFGVEYFKNHPQDDSQTPAEYLAALEPLAQDRFKEGWQPGEIKQALALIGTSQAYVRGSRLAALGRIDDAAEFLQEQLSDSTSDADVRLLLVQCYQEQGNLGGMIQAATELIDANPLEPMGYQQRAAAYRDLGNIHGAIRDLRKAQSMNISTLEIEQMLKDLQVIKFVQTRLQNCWHLVLVVPYWSGFVNFMP